MNQTQAGRRTVTPLLVSCVMLALILATGGGGHADDASGTILAQETPAELTDQDSAGGR